MTGLQPGPPRGFGLAERRRRRGVRERPQLGGEAAPVAGGVEFAGHPPQAEGCPLRVACNPPSTAPRPRLIRWRITTDAGTLAARMISPCSPVGSKKRRTLS